MATDEVRAKCADTWHICHDFIDPLADMLEEWLRKPQYTIDDIRTLVDLEVYCGEYACAPSGELDAWDHAKVWLGANISIEFRKSFEDQIRKVSEEGRSFLEEFASEPRTVYVEHGTLSDPTFVSLGLNVVTPLIEYLRSTSLVLHERLTARASMADAGKAWQREEAKEAKLSDKQVKQKTGKRGPKGPRTNAKEDARVYAQWKASGYRTIEQFASKVLGKTEKKEVKTVRDAIERERKRHGRMGRK